MTYVLVLTIHSFIRWIAVILGVLATVYAFRGWFGQKAWNTFDNRLGLWFTLSLDIQTLIGLVLYAFLSPITTLAFQDFGGAMKHAETRFWAVEHIMMMVIAVILAHVGRVLSKKGKTPLQQHRGAALLYLVTMIVLFLAIPCPFSRIARPLWPF
jgi:hypothetical protein